MKAKKIISFLLVLVLFFSLVDVAEAEGKHHVAIVKGIIKEDEDDEAHNPEYIQDVIFYLFKLSDERLDKAKKEELSKELEEESIESLQKKFSYEKLEPTNKEGLTEIYLEEGSYLVCEEKEEMELDGVKYKSNRQIFNVSEEDYFEDTTYIRVVVKPIKVEEPDKPKKPEKPDKDVYTGDRDILFTSLITVMAAIGLLITRKKIYES